MTGGATEPETAELAWIRPSQALCTTRTGLAGVLGKTLPDKGVDPGVAEYCQCGLGGVT